MQENYDNIDVLIACHLADEATPAQSAALDSWLAQSEANKAYFGQMKQVWETALKARIQPARSFDTEAALKKVKREMHPRPMVLHFAWRAAAAVAVLAVAVWWLWPQTAAPFELAATETDILTDTLTDGSVVTLNRNSALSVAKGFNQKERRMALQGEAYFEVAPNAEKPFLVTVKALEVKVVGTAFNIDNVNTPGKVLVAVTHGKVQLSAGKESLYLLAGESAEYDELSQNIRRSTAQQDPNTLAWKNKKFSFDATPLSEVVRQVSIAYGTSIALESPAISNCPLTARYNNLSLSRVLALISDSFSFKLEQKTDGTYVLKGVGCDG